MLPYTFYKTSEFNDWLDSLPIKSRKQLLNRLSKIEDSNYFGTHKYLESEGLWELKFNDGNRIYYIIVSKLKIILLLGGNKNGQDKDIRQASNILRKIIQNGFR